MPKGLAKRALVNKRNFSLETRDINEKKQIYYPHDPLNPQYEIRTKSGHKTFLIGEIPGNRPKQFFIWPNIEDSRRYIRSDDIDGAKASYKHC